MISTRRQLSVEYDTPPTFNRNSTSNYSNTRVFGRHSSTNSRGSNESGRIFHQQSQSNNRRRLNSTSSSAYDATQRTAQGRYGENNRLQEQEPRRSLTRALMETADSLKEAAMMATEACGLAMRKINEL
jgi:hypothetical protein